MSEFNEKYLESLDYDITDKIWETLEEKEFPSNRKCIEYIRDHWIDEHQESIEEAWEEETTFEIDDEDVEIYWFEYVGILMRKEEGNEN